MPKQGYSDLTQDMAGLASGLKARMKKTEFGHTKLSDDSTP